jgi:hypothetical protein
MINKKGARGVAMVVLRRKRIKFGGEIKMQFSKGNLIYISFQNLPI